MSPQVTRSAAFSTAAALRGCAGTRRLLFDRRVVIKVRFEWDPVSVDVGMGSMAEQHTIVGPAKGEPLPVGQVGVRLRIPLSGAPSRRWSRDLSARLTAEFAGHPNVGHLVLNDVVQAHEIVLEGVEAGEADVLADAVERAVEATNQACADAPDESVPLKPREEADAIARRVAERQRLSDKGASHDQK